MSTKIVQDVISKSENKIIESDATKLINSLPSNSVKLIITDPPYGIAYHSGHYKNKNPHTPVAHDWNFQISSFFRVAERALSEDGALYLFTRWDVYPLWVTSIPPTLKLKNCIVWMKNNWSAGDLKGNFGNQYELILFIVKGNHKIRGRRWSNIWQFPRIPAKKLRVATEKPVELLMRAIKASSDLGDIVIDPYCGSGSTGEAAVRCGRKFLLGDIDRSMIKIASQRLGVPFKEDDPVLISFPECPIMGVEPPEPHLWGIHPEDLANILKIENERNEFKPRITDFRVKPNSGAEITNNRGQE